MSKPKIFFSYSRADGSAFALKLAGDLKRRGFDVWIDQEDIRAGLDWDTEIEKALVNCDCVLFLETEKSVVSNNVLDEVYYAIDQHKKVIPLVYVDSRTPFRLNRLQHIDFTRNYDKGFSQLVNELEGNTPDLHPPETTVPLQDKRIFLNKNYRLFLFIACLALLVTAAILFMVKNHRETPAENRNAIVLTDTSHQAAEPGSYNGIRDTGEQEDEKAGARIAAKNATRKDQRKIASTPPVEAGGRRAEPAETGTGGLNNLTEKMAGDWSLVAVEPKAQSHRGYLKIDVLSENSATIKSYMQFYYPESKASSYLTVFNAFAGCTSCVVNKQIKLSVEDIAVGSRTIRKLQEDQPDGRKAGDIILDANANKSLRGTATLTFTGDHDAVITVKQPLTVTLANDFELQPFVYIFHFRKND